MRIEIILVDSTNGLSMSEAKYSAVFSLHTLIPSWHPPKTWWKKYESWPAAAG